MSYQITDGNIVAKGTDGVTRKFNKENVDIVIAECKAQGITNKYLIAGILATISKESGFVPQNENLNYSEEGLRKIFGSYFAPGLENPSDYARKPEKIANYIYGNSIKNGKIVPGRYGNIKPGDGWKFRGRGFNQITFQGNYKLYQDIIPDILENPDLLNNVEDAAKAAVRFYVRIFKKDDKKIKNNYNKSAYDMSDWNEALLLVINATAGLGKSKTNSSVKYNYDKAKLSHQFLIDYLEKNPEGTTVPPTNPSDVNNQEQEDFNNSQQSEDQQSDFSNNSDSDSVNGSGINITNLTQIFPPTIKPLDITIDTSGFTKREDKKKFEKGLGFQPLVWYNGVKIDTKDVISFTIGHTGIVPKIDLTLIDNYSFFREDGFPPDDTKITIYLNSRSINLRSIHMDFKIYDFKDIGDGSYSITGICDIPRLYLRKFNSYGSKTSYETMKDVAKDLNIGFCSNVSSSNDRMRWINTGLKNLDFIQNIIKNSYISDDSFQHCYIDFYYNLCYVDISKELNRDNSNDKMINAYGYSVMESSRGNDEILIPAILTNERNAKDSVAFFGEYEIFNKSTRVSIEKAYRIITKYYDSTKKELLLFDLESQTSDGNKTIILKGKPSDREFFNENIQTIWIGKQDLYDEGDGNVHENYNYAIAQNRQNLDDLTKISCKIILPNSNFNLYLFQKIFLAIYSIKPSPLNDKTFFKRFTGNWLITNISFIYDGEMKQEVTLVKRELELSEEEAKNPIPREKDINETSVSENVNELTPNEQEQLSENSLNELITPVETENTLSGTNIDTVNGTASTSVEVDTVNGTASTSVEEVEAEPVQIEPEPVQIEPEPLPQSIYVYEVIKLGPNRAIAVYRKGVEVYRGDWSFTQDIEILVQEAKLNLLGNFMGEEQDIQSMTLK